MKAASITCATMLALGACAATSPYTVAETRCNPARHQQLVGMNWGEVFLPPNLSVRLIDRDRIVPATSNPGRLNLHVDEKGWIQRISCG
ncbi:hypothetical protein KY389_03135 [Paracoccus bogoriensis]|uniref:hypothetical protein n=1 Tax=Paracoccus bogoriensis TaxID=242065 RepID=UPI001CA53210|nr:hypothetical protein [Paracoccus bogoriensis]MBW7055688.1 hypothetical protein [Paracoccus bogoriensis]